MAKRYNVGIDIDGVLADFTGFARRELQNLFAGRPDDTLVQTGWAFDSLGITREEENIFWRKVDNTTNWWLYLRTLPDTNALPEIVRNHRTIFITNRKDGTGWPIEMQSAEWLFNFYGISNPMVVISSDKGPVAKGLDLDYYIDDRPKNVDEVLAEHPKCRTYIQTQSYNVNAEYDLRVSSFNEFAAIIQRRANGKGN
jgi:hypothetical protein